MDRSTARPVDGNTARPRDSLALVGELLELLLDRTPSPALRDVVGELTDESLDLTERSLSDCYRTENTTRCRILAHVLREKARRDPSLPGAQTWLEVRPNPCITNDPCVLCGARCDPTGMDVFVTGTCSLVCDRCAEENVPGILAKAHNDEDPYADEDGNDPPTVERAGAQMWLGRGSPLHTYRDLSPAEADVLVRFVPEPVFGDVLWHLTDTALDEIIEALGRAHRLSPAVIAERYMRGYVQEYPIPEDGEEDNDPRPAPTVERAGAQMWLGRDSALRTYRDLSPAEADVLVRFVPGPVFGAVVWHLTDTALDEIIEALMRADRPAPAVIAERYIRGYVQENPIPEDGEDQ